MNKKVVVIGAGIGGLGTAGLFAKKGYDVTVLEKNENFGGRANIFEAQGFRFDMGPSWYLAPDIFEHYFNLLGENISDHLKLKKLQPSYRIFFRKDSSPLDIHSDLDIDTRAFDSIEPGSGEKLREYLKQSEYQYDVATRAFHVQELRHGLRFFESTRHDRRAEAVGILEDAFVRLAILQIEKAAAGDGVHDGVSRHVSVRSSGSVQPDVAHGFQPGRVLPDGRLLRIDKRPWRDRGKERCKAQNKRMSPGSLSKTVSRPASVLPIARSFKPILYLECGHVVYRNEVVPRSLKLS